MSTEPTEDRLGELLLRWDELRRQGRDLTAGELCTDCPELVDELARRIEAVRDMDSVLDIEDTDAPLEILVTEDLNGASANRRLPDALHASAVYRPQRHHAQGGLGEVLAAHQEELDRTVALKRIRPDKLHEAARRRFLREAAITARLQHPGIVPIYGLGQDDDGPFYTMPFIEGQTLQEAIEGFPRGRIPPTRPRPAEPEVPRPAPAVHHGLQHGGLCPRPGGRAPRPEAVEHHAGPVRRDAGHGLGPGQAIRPGRLGRRGWRRMRRRRALRPRT